MRQFNYCPCCGARDLIFDGVKKFECRACSLTFFQNVAAAVAAILEYKDKILLIERAKEPGKGKLDLPGGFIDPKETAEDGLIREIKEELYINPGKLKYLGSSPNIYKYESVLYNTCDLFFYCPIDALPTEFDKSEIAELVLVDPKEVPEDKLAFGSTKTGLLLYSTRNPTL